MQNCAAIAVVFSTDKKSVLLVQRRDTPVWVLPGGGIDLEESPAEAAVRETLEETGVTVSATRLVAKYFPTNQMGRITYLYECELVSGSPGPTDEARQAVFHPLNKLPSAFFVIHQKWLQDALSKHPAPLEKPLEGVTYLQFIKFMVCHPWITFRYALSRLGLPWNSR